MEFLDILDNFFKSYKKAISFYQLMRVLDVKAEDKHILERCLYQLQIQGKVYQDEYGNYLHVSQEFYLKSGFVNVSNKGNFYIVFNGETIHLKRSRYIKLQKGDYVYVELVPSINSHYKYQEAEVRSIVRKPVSMDFPNYLVKGVIHETDRHVFLLILDDRVIEVDKSDLGTAYHGDIVTAEVYEDYKKVRAKVRQILERKNDCHIFEYCKHNGNLCWVPVGTNYYSVLLENNDNEYKEHDKILAKVKTTKDGITFIEGLEKLDQKQENFNVANEIINRHGFSSSFSESTKEEVEKLVFGDISSKRNNYINLKTVTIDGDNAKDFDDAISIEKLSNGNYILYVHIADVTNYVKKGTNLYQEAYERGTSVYLEDFVFPMLPEILSNDLCSLNPNELKLTVTCKMEIDNKGNIVDFLISESIIKSDKRMTYKNVDKVLENGIIPDGYEEFKEELLLMKELSDILKQKKLKRGYTYFDNSEISFEFDENGHPINVVKENYSTSREIIENFMLAANETVSSYLYYLDVPTLYRNHEAPKIFYLEKVIYRLKKTGYLKGRINEKDPYFIAKLLKRYRGKKEFSYLSKIILNSMTKAYYDINCNGHFGLSLDHYLHFTSPIRRFPDIKVHESLKGVWNGDLFIDKQELKKDGIFLSEREVASKEAEREYQHYLMDLYVCDYLGSEVEAEIIFIDNDNIYLMALGYVEGLLKHNSNYDREHKQIYFEGKTYKIGDKINVVLRKFSKEFGQYIFTRSIPKEKKLTKKRG